MKPLDMFRWLLPATLVAAAAQAQTVVVPDDFPTIQQAVASGADTVLVKDGSYPETVVLDQPVALLAFEPPYPYDAAAAFPVVSGLVVGPVVSPGAAQVRGFRFTGPVLLRNPFGGSDLVLLLEECRLEGGLARDEAVAMTSKLRLRGCLVYAGAVVSAYSYDVSGNAFIACGLVAHHEGYGLIRGNDFSGPAAFAVHAQANESGLEITDNQVRGTVNGIVLVNPSQSLVRGNRVSDCAGDAYRATNGGIATFADDEATVCAGSGFVLEVLSAEVTGCTVTNAGGDGVRFTGSEARLHDNRVDTVSGYGIRVTSGYASQCYQNRVVRAGQQGIRLAEAGAVHGNVVGRSAGAGLVVLGAADHLAIHHNTSYLNGGPGYEIHGAAGDSVTNDIAHGNLGYGLDWTGSAPFVGCNDWFGNTLGRTHGTPPGPTDIEENPLFCDLPNDDVMIGAASPCAETGTGCGRIGALDVGCSLAAGVPGGGSTAFAAWPRPATGGVRFAWPRLQERAALEVFDAAGARRWSTSVPAGSGGLAWDGRGPDGARLPAGVYFARLSGPRRSDEQRIVLAH